MKRRTLVATAAAASLAACSGGVRHARPAPTLILIHGAWHGAWCWERVMPLLARAGCRSIAVTLPGMGERSAELSPAIDLDHHIDAVAEAAWAADGPVALVGHSYGGFVITGAADRLAAAPEKLRALVYVDAFVPSAGERVSDHMPQAARAALAARLAAGDPAYPPVPARFFGLSDPEDIAWVEARLTAQPAATYFQPLRLDRALPATVRRAYVACESPRLAAFDATKARVRANPAWAFHALQTGHDAMITAPADLAALLIRLA